MCVGCLGIVVFVGIDGVGGQRGKGMPTIFAESLDTVFGLAIFVGVESLDLFFAGCFALGDICFAGGSCPQARKLATYCLRRQFPVLVSGWPGMRGHTHTT